MEDDTFIQVATHLKNKINQKLPKGWHGRIVKLKPKSLSRCRLQVQLYTPKRNCIRTRNGLKKYCADHGLDIRHFDGIKFFYNPSSYHFGADIVDQDNDHHVATLKKTNVKEDTAANNDKRLQDSNKPAKLKMDDIYTMSTNRNSPKTFAKEEPRRWYPKFSNLGEVDDNCQIGRKYLSCLDPGSAMTQPTFSCHTPVLCDRIKSETLTKTNQVIITFFPRSQGLDTIYGFIEARLTGRFEYKRPIIITDESRFWGKTPFENFRYYV